MILCVGLNPAIDVTYHVPKLAVGATNRVGRVDAQAGGKATNVARVLHQLGEPTRLLALAGGRTGVDFVADLQSSGVPAQIIPIAGATRRTVAVIDAVGATLLNEPGPDISPAEWRAFLDSYRLLVASATVVVLSGSIPPGLARAAYSELVRLARLAGAVTVLDAEGPELLSALAARPTLVKLNLAELSTTMTREIRDESEVACAAAELRECGAQAVVVSRGADGLIAVTGSGTWNAVAVSRSGNPTGAGDALAAGLAVGLGQVRDWDDVLVDAVALATAAVGVGVAGAVDLAMLARVRATVSSRRSE